MDVNNAGLKKLFKCLVRKEINSTCLPDLKDSHRKLVQKSLTRSLKKVSGDMKDTFAFEVFKTATVPSPLPKVPQPDHTQDVKQSNSCTSYSQNPPQPPPDNFCVVQESRTSCTTDSNPGINGIQRSFLRGRVGSCSQTSKQTNKQTWKHNLVRGGYYHMRPFSKPLIGHGSCGLSQHALGERWGTPRTGHSSITDAVTLIHLLNITCNGILFLQLAYKKRLTMNWSKEKPKDLKGFFVFQDLSKAAHRRQFIHIFSLSISFSSARCVVKKSRVFKSAFWLFFLDTPTAVLSLLTSEHVWIALNLLTVTQWPTSVEWRNPHYTGCALSCAH